MQDQCFEEKQDIHEYMQDQCFAVMLQHCVMLQAWMHTYVTHAHTLHQDHFFDVDHQQDTVSSNNRGESYNNTADSSNNREESSNDTVDGSNIREESSNDTVDGSNYTG